MLQCKAGIFDLEGVIAQTNTLHQKAWEETFKQFQEAWEKDGRENFAPYNPKQDYEAFLEGKTRLDGVRRFLASRELVLDDGNPSDSLSQLTIQGLGNLKGSLFEKILDEQPVEIFEENIQAIEKWREKGLKAAVVSPSQHCLSILHKAGLVGLFNVRVDGFSAEQLNFTGKPSPALLLEAARKLDIAPSEIFTVDNTLAGMEAGKEGGFVQVVGVLGEASNQNLKENGADLAVEMLRQVPVEKGTSPEILPNFWDHKDKIAEKLTQKPVFLMPDFDGTLAPIVADHQQAALDEPLRETLRQLMEATQHMAIISGRGLDDVRDKVDIPDLWYAGSHGFEIAGPDDFYHRHEEAAKVLPELDKATEELRQKVAELEGIRIETKNFATAMHYRDADKATAKQAKRLVGEVVQARSSLKQSGGKKIVEMQPDMEWHKGKAVGHLIQELELNHDEIVSVYAGDDLTDEYAFEAIQQSGIGLLVGDHGHRTQASYRLKDTDDVHRFLHWLLKLIR